jgi:hypothetical protein
MEMEMVEQMNATDVQDAADMMTRLEAVTARLEAAAERLAIAEDAAVAAAAQASSAGLRGAMRKTTGAGVGSLMAKEGATVEAGHAAGVLDRALVSLSLEQRIAVKAQLLQSGLL